MTTACPPPDDYYAHVHDYAEHEQILAHYDTIRQVFEEAAELVYPLFAQAIQLAARVERATRAGHLADALRHELAALLDHLQPREEAYLEMLHRMRSMCGNDTYVTEYGETSVLFRRKNELVNRINDNLAVIQQRDEARDKGGLLDEEGLYDDEYDADCSEAADNDTDANDYGYDWDDTWDREREKEEERQA